MIESTTFLGMPLRTLHQRRILVVGYYVVLLFFAAVALWMAHDMLVVLLPQTVMLGGLLGGIKMGGPVKPYAAPAALESTGSIVSLNLQGRRRFGSSSPLDEREQMQRDHAHYTAYRILMLTLGLAFAICWMPLDSQALWLKQREAILLWLLLVYALSLPQSVLLWTEPADPSGELIEMR